jgi:hypothetical protein
MRKIGFLSSPGAEARDHLYHRPTRSREVVAKFGVEPKRRARKEEPKLPRSVRIGLWRPNAERIVLTRADLFERVWSVPVQRLAKGWGLSDRGLAKACASLRIPVPPRGYWAKLQHGRSVGRPHLPVLQPGEAEEIVVIVPAGPPSPVPG